VTAYRPPRGGKSEGSGEKKKLVPRFDSARSPASIFRVAAKIAAEPNRSPDATPLSGVKSAAGIATAQDRCAEAPARPDTEFDEAAFGRAEAAFQFEFDKWQRIIDAARSDKGLTRDKRAAAVAALRIRQQIEAAGARRRVLEEETQRLRAAHERSCRLLDTPTSR
jgi:hypothetical protein